eukprot:m.126996 g.126996  ORF g.126996 m.126996 type:complete len:718 (+) comp9402_c2_seq1:367-2520(+)
MRMRLLRRLPRIPGGVLVLAALFLAAYLVFVWAYLPEDESGLLPNDCRTVHVAMMVAGISTARSAVITVKSILALRTTALHFHFLVDDAASDTLKTLFNTWRLENVQCSYYNIAEHILDVAWVKTAHSSGAFGLAKLTYDVVLPHVSTVIAVDADVLFTCDVARLALYTDYFDVQQMIGAVAQQSDWYINGSVGDLRPDVVWPAAGRGINTGVLLLDLDRMRQERWRDLWSRLAREELRVRTQTGLADQDIFNLVALHHPDLVYELPCSWNVQAHAHVTQHCYREEKICAIHWNSPEKLLSEHALAREFRDRHELVKRVDGRLLRSAPSFCGAESRSAQANDLDDHVIDCAAIIRAGAHVYRTHVNYAVLAEQQGLYNCTAARMPWLPARVVQPVRTHVQARSVIAAQARFATHLATLHKRLRVDAADAARLDSVGILCEKAANPQPHARAAPAVDITAVLHLSADRISSLQGILRAWQGPISVAIYASDDYLDKLDWFLDNIDDRTSPVAVHLVFVEGPFYPVNFMRNVALRAVHTSHAIMLDIDLVPSLGSYKALLQLLRVPRYAASAIIVPAFETDAYSTIKLDEKEDAVHAWRAEQIRPFRVREWPQGHAATNYSRWAVADEPFPAALGPGAEPYFVLPAPVPLYDQRFVGFGWNKVSYVATLARERSFFVAPDAFVVHRGHAPSPDLAAFRSRPEYRACMQELLGDVLERGA